MPAITVLMSVYNGMPYLPEAVESIRRQTFQDWILLLINDGSTDGSADYLNQLNEPRLRVVNQTNQGLAAALNHGLQLCETEFLARLDADDVALPTRLQKQLAFLHAHPRVGLVGTQIAPLGENGVGRGGSLYCDHRAIDTRLMQGRHAMCHSSILCRTELLREIGGYWPLGVSEDWDLYLRMAERSELANLDEVLMQIRVTPGGLQGRQMAEIRRRVAYACESALRRRSNQPPMTYETFCLSRQSDSAWKRFYEALDVHAMVHYRKAQAEILGPHPALGYARLAWAATCSPPLTWQRCCRIVRQLGSARRRRAIASATPSCEIESSTVS